MLDALRLYTAMGWPIFPCSNQDKSPLTPHGFKDATTDISIIKVWLDRHPGCAWGVRTSASRAVMDVDPRHGGDDTLTALVEANGPMPVTPITETGGGGLHYWLAFAEGTGSKPNAFGKGIDLKAEGGYVIVPPSKILIPEHHQPYRFRVKPWDVAIADASRWMVEMLKPMPKVAIIASGTLCDNPSPWIVQAEANLANHPGSPEGQRRVTLCRLVGTALSKGMKLEEVWALASQWASRCSPEFQDWQKHVGGLLKREAEQQPIAFLPLPSPDPLEGKKDFPSQTPDAPNAEPEFFLSFLPEGGKGDSEKVMADGGCKAEAIPLHADAHYGIAGSILEALIGKTEAHPPSVLASMLTAFGSAIGLKPTWNHGMPHGGNMNILLVGPTTARKGTAWAVGSWLVREADSQWASRIYSEGFGSGEGLIWAVRDEVKTMKLNPKTGIMEEHVQDGEPDKRLLVVEEEMSKALKLSKGKDSILSAIIREAFDRKPIGKLNKGEGRYRCASPHISIVGHCTPDELRAELHGTSFMANGFVNRFLIVDTRREVYIPRNGNWHEALKPFLPAIADALAFAKAVGHMALDDEAGRYWDSEYRSLEERPEGIMGMATGRASDYAMKLSMLYALLDKADAIRLPHLRAGLAFWRYCEASAYRLFGESSLREPIPDPLWLRLLNAIQADPGIAKSELLRVVRESADAIGQSLEGLRVKGLAHCLQGEAEGSGRKAERWYPGSREGEDAEQQPQPSPSRNPLPPSPLEGKKELADGTSPEGKKELADGPSAEAVEGKKELPQANSFLPESPSPEGKKELAKGETPILSFLPNPEGGKGEGCMSVVKPIGSDELLSEEECMAELQAM